MGTAARRSGSMESLGTFWMAIAPRVCSVLLLAGLTRLGGQVVWHTLGFAPPEAPPATSVPARPAEREARIVSFTAKGVGSPFPAPVGKMLVEPGQKVKQGQPLFRMDVSDLQRKLADSEQRRKTAAGEAARHRADRISSLRPYDETLRRLQREEKTLAQGVREAGKLKLAHRERIRTSGESSRHRSMQRSSCGRCDSSSRRRAGRRKRFTTTTISRSSGPSRTAPRPRSARTTCAA